MTAPDARTIAWKVLSQVDEGRHADVSLRAEAAALGDQRDRALATELVYGVLRWRARLDHELQGRLRGKTDARLRNILRIGLYQLRFLDRVPAHAALHAAVEQAKRHGFKHAAGLVNAVLRGLQRDGEPAWPGYDDAASLALRFSHPQWLVDGWIAQYGIEATKARLAANQETPPLGVRIRRGDPVAAVDRLRERGADVRLSEGAKAALRVRGGGDPLRWPEIASGDWVIQDEGAQAMAALLPPADRHVDLCAAPGGKAFALADRDTDAEVIAVDADPRRLEDLEAMARRLGLAARIRIVQADASQAVPQAAGASSILVDAPCSGLGTLRRNPDRKWREPPSSDLPSLQRAILRAAARELAPGGRLLYVTCTLWKPENEGVVEAFEAEFADFRRLRTEHPFLTESGLYQSDPAVHGCDGFFGALWQKGAPLSPTPPLG